MKRTISQLTSRNTKQQHVYFTIPIARYFNRSTGKKAPTAKGQVKLQVLKEKLLIKEERSAGEWVVADIMALESIDKVEDIEKPEEKYTLLKIQLNTVPEREKVDKAITFRVLNLMLGRDVTHFIRKNLNDIEKLPNYINIEANEANVMKSIILMQPEYQQVYKKAQEKKLFASDSNISVFQFQRVLLSDHPDMRRFNLLKHTLKYEQQKSIFLQRLSMNAEQAEKEEKMMKQQKFKSKHNKINLIESSNINFHSIEEDLQKMRKDGKQGMEGYSSKREFEGMNLTGGQEELYQKDKPAPYDLNEKNEHLVLNNISVIPQDSNENLFQQNYHDYSINQSTMRQSQSFKNTGDPQKMQIEQGEINDNSHKDSSVKFCTRMRILDSTGVRLEQKREENRSEKKSDVKFIDPSYSFQKEASLARQTVIWCRLFYYFLKEGGVEKREHQLTVIENQLKKLKHTEKDVKMSDLVSKMVDKVSTNYLRMKRGQDVY